MFEHFSFKNSLYNGFFYFVVGIWFCLNLWATQYGLPQLLNPDEHYFVNGAYKILRPAFGDPEWYGAPASTLMDVLAFFYGFYIVFLMTFMGIQNPGEYLLTHPEGYVLIGRIVCVVIYLITVFAFIALSKRLLPNYAALFASLCFMFSPAIAFYSQIVRMDTIMTLFLILTFHACINIQKGGGLKPYAFSGMALGAAVVSKFPAVIGCFAIIVSSLMAWRQKDITFLKSFKYLIFAGVCSLISAFIFGPYLFLNMSEMLNDVLFESNVSRPGANSNGFLFNLTFYMTEGIPNVVGIGIYILSLIGTILALFKKSTFYPYLAYALLFLLFISSLSLFWTRWAIPLIPVLCLTAGYAVYAMHEFLQGKIKRDKAVAFAVILTALALPSIFQSSKTTLLRGLGYDTRIIAYHWALDNLPKDATILIEPHAAQLSVDQFTIYTANEDGIDLLQKNDPLLIRPKSTALELGAYFREKNILEALPDKVDYIITSGFHERYEKEPEAHQKELSVYNKIKSISETVKEFKTGPYMLGETVTIYKVKK